MLVFDPPEVMEFTWGTDRLRIELRADGAGWHEYLDRLVSELDGTPQQPMGELWVEVHPRYVTHLGPDAATIGPPPVMTHAGRTRSRAGPGSPPGIVRPVAVTRRPGSLPGGPARR